MILSRDTPKHKVTERLKRKGEKILNIYKVNTKKCTTLLISIKTGIKQISITRNKD